VTNGAAENRVTPLELFFDLVFVFAITRVTAYLAEHPTWSGLLHGALILGVLWWAWAAFAWLTNTLDDAEQRLGRLAIFVAMGGMLVASLCVTGAFGANALLFALAMGTVRLAHLAVYALAADNVRLRTAVFRMSPSVAVAIALLVLASAFDGRLQAACWGLALLIDYTAPLLSGTSGWRVDPGHFAERHGLIVIIALGESIVALGVGAAPQVGSLRVLTTLLGLAVVGALWWAYFDVVALVAERKLRETTGAARNAMARDSYSYLHYLLLAGIVLFALGLKEALDHVREPLELVPAFALCGGPALYLVGHVLFRLRNVGTVNRQRVVAAALLLALVPLADRVDALWGLTAVAGVCVGLIAYAARRFADVRARVRGTGVIETS
jgi:low temperature requirement protein LtrA